MRMKQAATPRVRRGVRGARSRAWHRFVLAVQLAVQLGVLMAVFTSDTAHAEVLAQAKSVSEVLGNIRTWLMAILASLATVFLTIGGVRYVLAGGDPGEVEKAKTAFKAAGLGFMLAALAPLVVAVLEGFVGL